MATESVTCRFNDGREQKVKVDDFITATNHMGVERRGKVIRVGDTWNGQEVIDFRLMDDSTAWCYTHQVLGWTQGSADLTWAQVEDELSPAIAGLLGALNRPAGEGDVIERYGRLIRQCEKVTEAWAKTLRPA